MCIRTRTHVYICIKRERRARRTRRSHRTSRESSGAPSSMPRARLSVYMYYTHNTYTPVYTKRSARVMVRGWMPRAAETRERVLKSKSDQFNMYILGVVQCDFHTLAWVDEMCWGDIYILPASRAAAPFCGFADPIGRLRTVFGERKIGHEVYTYTVYILIKLFSHRRPSPDIRKPLYKVYGNYKIVTTVWKIYVCACASGAVSAREE